MDFWNHIYERFDPVAFHLFSFSVHWYAVMYVLALFSALIAAKWIVKKDKVFITEDQLEDYFIYAEIGVIVGARLGYILFYDTHTMYYLTHPWQIFNPFMDGAFVGIHGMSYHGALIGFLIASWCYSKRHGVPTGLLMDVVAIAIPLGYIFGRIGNFLNQELIGRATEVPWGIYVYDTLRHPSQLYEAVLEGVVVFAVVYAYRHHKRFEGELILVYGFFYGAMRFIVEFWREPDAQIGFICCGWLSMGQMLCALMMMATVMAWVYANKCTRQGR